MHELTHALLVCGRPYRPSSSKEAAKTINKLINVQVIQTLSQAPQLEMLLGAFVIVTIVPYEVQQHIKLLIKNRSEAQILT